MESEILCVGMVVLKKEANLPSSLEDTALNTPTHTLPPTTTHRRKPNACILEDKKISMYQTVASTSDHRASPIQAWAHDSDTNHTVSQTNSSLKGNVPATPRRFHSLFRAVSSKPGRMTATQTTRSRGQTKLGLVDEDCMWKYFSGQNMQLLAMLSSMRSCPYLIPNN